MEHDINHLGQPVGFSCRHWRPPDPPSRRTHVGRYCLLEPLEVDRHGAQLYEAFSLDVEGRDWTYLPYGPFQSEAEFLEWVRQVSPLNDPLFFAIVDRASQRAEGVANYLRITPASGSIEVGHIHYSPRLKGTAAGHRSYVPHDEARL